MFWSCESVKAESVWRRFDCWEDKCVRGEGQSREKTLNGFLTEWHGRQSVDELVNNKEQMFVDKHGSLCQLHGTYMMMMRRRRNKHLG